MENHKSEMEEEKASQSNEDAKKTLFYTHIVVGVCQGCFFIYASLLPYLAKEYGLDAISFGYLLSTCAILQLILSPLIGRFGDHYGARAVLLLSALSTMCGHVTLGMAGSATWLVFSKLTTLFQDIRLGGQMVVSDLVAGPERGVAMGTLMVPMSIGMFLGPLAAGQLAKYHGTQGSLLITWLGPLFCMAVLLLFIPRVTKSQKPQPGPASGSEENVSLVSLAGHGPIPLLITIKLLTTVPFLTFAQNITVISATVFKLTPQTNGLILAYNGILGMIVNGFLLGKLSKNYSEEKLLKIASLLMILSYGLLSQTYSVWMLPVIFVPWCLGNAILDNQVISRLTRIAPVGKTGAVMGLNAAVFQMARIIAPLLGGYLVQNLGFQAIGYFGFGVSLILAGLIMFLMNTKTHDKHQ